MDASPDEKRAAIAAYESGKTLRQTAAAVGVAPSTVRLWLIAAGTSRRGRTGRPSLSVEQRTRIESLLADGTRVALIASDVGVHRSTVYRIRAEMGSHE